ncbi:metalloprotease TIKI2-like [Amphibalanus amphitrite]|uniref:metalloprotease TIKI2-like n=1 Tax=Amphibalanus amphitrite TaxID=1232801 RepID=UPI001C8FEE3C|nr:metalloprotease TIKI2-like [Amphibalanus amphitrite]
MGLLVLSGAPLPRLIYMLLVIVVALSGAEARRSRRPDYCDPQSRQSSFLWRIDTKPPSYFFGTIHVPYNRVWEHIPENVKRAFRLADSVFFELDLTDEHTISALTKCQLLPRGARLEQLLPGDIYRRLEKHLDYVRNMMPLWLTADQRGRGLYADYLFNAIAGNWEQKRPIWVMLMVNMLTESDVRARGVPVLDLYLALEAKKTKRTGAVERVEEQCLPLNGLNISQVVFALNQTLNQHESIRAGEETPLYTTEDLIRHYNCGDLDEVIFRRDSSQIPPSVFQVPPLQSAAAAASAAQRVTAHSIEEYFRDELIYKRNRRMGERILELLWARPNESYFFAFGAGHFLGNYSVLDVLRQAGYKVTKVGPRERIRRYNRRRRPGGGGRRIPPSEGARYRGSEPPSRQEGRRRHGARHRDNKYGDNFSDLWVRIDDSQDSEPDPVVSRSDETVRVLFGLSSDTSVRSATDIPRSSAALLTALLLIVAALSPPRT